jgi:hypothetical protein
MKKLFLIACIVLLTMSANAQTDNTTYTPVTFETEEQFAEHLINKTVELYTPTQIIDIEWQGLMKRNHFFVCLNLKDTKIKLYAPFSVLEEQYDGALLTLELTF